MMAYRVKKSCEDSSSDEDGPPLRKEQKLNDTDESIGKYGAGRKAAQMWTDLLDEQSLSDSFSGKVGVYRGKSDLVERGVESYTVPEVRPSGVIHDTSYKKRGISSYAYDNEPFDFVADEENIENSCCKHRQILSRRQDRPGNRAKKERSRTSSEDLWKLSASSSRITLYADGKSKRNNYGLNTIAKNNHVTGYVGNGDISLKRKRSDRNSPIALLSDNYSLEKLMTTEFPPNLTLNELGKCIAEALGERDPKFLLSVINEIGEKKALELFETTRGIEVSGGMMVADGTRRRTPGGVFMTLFKSDHDILPVIKEKVGNMGKAAGRELKKAKRRKQYEAACKINAAPERMGNEKEVQTVEKFTKGKDVLCMGIQRMRTNSSDAMDEL